MDKGYRIVYDVEGSLCFHLVSLFYFVFQLISILCFVLNRRVVEEVAKRVGAEVLKLLSVLHEHGIWHQDPHIGNILYFGDDVKIIDFGAAIELRKDVRFSFAALYDQFYFASTLGILDVYYKVALDLPCCFSVSYDAR